MKWFLTASTAPVVELNKTITLCKEGFCSGKSDTNLTTRDSSFFEKHGIVKRYLEQREFIITSY